MLKALYIGLTRIMAKPYLMFYHFRCLPSLLYRLSLYKNKGAFFGISYAQHCQDIFVINYYHQKPKKLQYTFVDIGANDGISFSNTYLLETLPQTHWAYQNWSGILIEADSAMYEKLLVNRSSAKTTKYNVALCDKDGEVAFLQISGAAQMLSGIVSEYDKKHLLRIEREIQSAGGGGVSSIIKMQGARFGTIMANHPHITEIDYLSIDVEGAEYKILETIDFNAYIIHLIGIEDNYPFKSGIAKYLQRYGYREVAHIGCDRFFERIDSKA